LDEELSMDHTVLIYTLQVQCKSIFGNTIYCQSQLPFVSTSEEDSRRNMGAKKSSNGRLSRHGNQSWNLYHVPKQMHDLRASAFNLLVYRSTPKDTLWNSLPTPLYGATQINVIYAKHTPFVHGYFIFLPSWQYM